MSLDHIEMAVHAAIPGKVGPLFDRMALTVREANRKVYPNLFGITPNDTRIPTQIQVARDRNIKLVEDAHREYAASVRQIIDDPANFGERVEVIKKKLLDRGDVSESRAALIARDQTLKLNGAINQTRQTNAGVTKYVWSTSKDDRVRENHAEKEGEEFDWNSPPADTGHPGEDYQCRCVAIPVVEELEDLF